MNGGRLRGPVLVDRIDSRIVLSLGDEEHRQGDYQGGGHGAGRQILVWAAKWAIEEDEGTWSTLIEKRVENDEAKQSELCDRRCLRYKG